MDWCRKNYHIELDELASRAGIKSGLLRRAYKGEMVLTAEQLWDLGETLDLEMSFMRKRDISKGEIRLPHFRAASCRPQPSTELMMLLGRMERHRGHFEGVLDESPRRNARRVKYPSQRSGAGYASKAKAVRRWLGISGDASFAELRGRVEAKDIMVFVSNSWRRWGTPVNGKGEDQFKGFALRHELLPIIFVAKEREERDQSFTLMHELAHLLLHKGDAIDGADSLDALLSRGNKQEQEANTLAGYILLSEEARGEVDVLPLEGKEVRKLGQELDRICKRHGAGKAAVLAYLAASRGAAAAARAHNCWTQSMKQSKKKTSKKEAEAESAKKIWDIFGYRYVTEVMDAEANERITTHKALVYMNVDLDTFQIMVKQKDS